MTFVVPDFERVPGTDLVQAVCYDCGHRSRKIRTPTEREKQRARERTGDLFAVIYPDTPYGWDRGCPRCRS